MPQLYVQPQFSRNLQTTYLGMGASNFGTIFRGYMEWDTALTGYSGLAKVNFQFNPSTLAAAYNLDLNNPTISDFLFSNPADSAVPWTPMDQSISFALLYDRTYDLWGSYGFDGQPAGQSPDWHAAASINDPAMAGVGVDILAMQQFTGMIATAEGAVGKGNAPAQANGQTDIYKPQGVMIPWPAWVYFGPNPMALYYYGFISDWSVQVTHWTQFMVPMRCVINVDFTLLPTTATASNTPAGPGLQNWWNANPLVSSVGPGNLPGPGGAAAQPSAGGIRG